MEALGNVSILPGEVRTYSQKELQPVHKLFEDIVASAEDGHCMSEKEAIRFDNKSVSYGELNTKANLLARGILHKLTADGIKIEDLTRNIVGIMIPASDDRIMALLAIFKLNAAYLPLDPVIPVNRRKHMLDEARPICIIASSSSVAVLNEDKTQEDVPVYNYSNLLAVAEELKLPPDNLTDEDLKTLPQLLKTNKLACVLYTSGSTGVPKGVLLSHNSIVRVLHWHWEKLPVQEDEIGAATVDLLFVDSVRDIFCFLLKGRPIVVFPKSLKQDPEKLIQELEKHKVTRMACVSSLLNMMLMFIKLDNKPRLTDLRMLLPGGETLTSVLIEGFFSLFPTGCQLVNMYGSTETIGDATAEFLPNLTVASQKTHNYNVSIGKPVFNCWAYVVNEHLEPVPMGEYGEICFSGPTMSDGYIGHNKMENFAKNGIKEAPGHPFLYKTGDYGRIIGGRIYFEGRKDIQIKIRGQRVNMSEILNVIQSVQGVQKVEVLNYHHSEHVSVLVAFYTCEPGKRVEPEIVLQSCVKNLISYMVPEVIRLDTFPLQPVTQKVDRQGLKKMYTDSFCDDAEFELTDVIMEKVFRAAASVLGMKVSALKLHHNFFDIGGNSINAVHLLVKLKEEKLNVNLRGILGATTMKNIIDTVKNSEEIQPVSVADPERYSVIKLIDPKDIEDTIQLMLQTFFTKDPTVSAVNCPRDTYLDHLRKFWPYCEKDDMSFAVRDNKLNKIVGGYYIICSELDYDELVDPVMVPISQFLMIVERPLREKLATMPDKRWAWAGHVATDLSVSHEENLRLLHILEEEAIRVVQARGFDGMVTVNTNPATVAIAELEHGWISLNRVKMRDFEYNGFLPLASVPDDYYGVAQIKYL